MSGLEHLMAAAIWAPLLFGAAGLALGRRVGAAVGAVGAVLGACLMAALVLRFADGGRAALAWPGPFPETPVALRLEAAGLLLGTAAAALAALTALFTLAQRPAEGAPAALAAPLTAPLMALGAGVAAGAALAENLFVFFVFQEAAGLIAAALIAQSASPEDRRAALGYLAALLALSAAFLAPAMLWTAALAGGLAFTAGGVLPEGLPRATAEALTGLYIAGFARLALAAPVSAGRAAHPGQAAAAIAAQAALTPLIALLGLIKTTVFLIGPDVMQALWAPKIAMGVAAAAALWAGAAALGKADLGARLASSAAAQWPLAALGALAAHPAALFGAALHAMGLGCAQAVMVMAAAAAAAATGRTRTNQFEGLGRAMPWMIGAMALAVLSLAGAPPLVGAWGRLWLAAGTAAAGQAWAAAVIALSAALSLALFGPMIVRALFSPAAFNPFTAPDAATPGLVPPVAAAAAAMLGGVFMLDALAAFLGPGLAP